MDGSTPGCPVLHYLPEFAQRVGDAIEPSHPLLSPSPPDLNFCPASGSFSNELVLLIRWPKFWSFSFSIRPSSEYSGLISFRMDWFDLLAVQKHRFLALSLLYGLTLTSVHDSWENHSFDYMDLCWRMFIKNRKY